MKVFTASGCAVFFMLLCISCTKILSKKTGIVEFEKVAFEVTEVFTLYSNNSYLKPLRSIEPGTVLELSVGKYSIASDCSMHTFDVLREAKKVIKLSHVELTPSLTPVHTSCVDPVDNELHESRKTFAYSILPGKTELEIGAQKMTFEASEGETRVIPVQLHSHVLKLPESFSPQNIPLSKDSLLTYFVKSPTFERVISFQAGETQMLPAGDYELELNGTKKTIKIPIENVEAGLSKSEIAGSKSEIAGSESEPAVNESEPAGSKSETTFNIPLGILKVVSPAQAQNSAKFIDGNKPVFAFVNDVVLFDLDTEYLVFPGSYSLGMQGSDHREVFKVNASETTKVYTSGILIEPPPCAGKQCLSQPTITLHKDEKSFPLMHIPAGQSFLVIKGKFEFGVEGIRGIVKRIPGIDIAQGKIHTEKLSRLKINWKNIPSNDQSKTDYVRIEGGTGGNIVGRSLDLLYNKPAEIVLPNGNYVLSYFVQNPSGSRPKTNLQIQLSPGELAEVTVPLYSPRSVLNLGNSSNSAVSSKDSKEADSSAMEGRKIDSPSQDTESTSDGKPGENGLSTNESANGISKPKKPTLPKGLEPLRK